jgi:3'-phosphoadenosine 5'-phosphosulfate sulfotransferase (PAPS reductase)/FAD synthetase
MTNPFKIEGPAVVACSFGRTSGYMLWRILDAWNGKLPPDVWVMFENTGMERDETLDFGHELQTRWFEPLEWLEYRRQYLPEYKSEARREAAAKARAFCGHDDAEPANGRTEPGFVRVTYETAHRRDQGDERWHPFHNLIDMMGLPNSLTRLCTSEMKIRVAKKAMMGLGYKEWTNVLGLRADEPKRVARMGAPSSERWENICPLSKAGVIKKDVLSFWDRQDFNLNLPVDETGETYAGNCDLCFMKGSAKKVRLIGEEPGVLSWWLQQELRTGQTFREHGQTVRHLQVLADERRCDLTNDDDLGDCVCHD